MAFAPSHFGVALPQTTVVVTAANGVVTAIRLRAHGKRHAETPFERLVEKELAEYGKGERSAFTFPVYAEGSLFCQEVWRELQKIPYGATATYGEIARRVAGNTGAAQAVGQANHMNPIPIVIPCHRVVAAGGKLGGYGGGVDLKRRLLALEEAHSPALV